jgi:arylsulfatase A-like enzyme
MNLNDVAIPELKRLARKRQPFLLFLRHMDPHSPYLPPEPFERIFYGGNEKDKKNHSIQPVMAFKPFCDYFASWFPPGLQDIEYVSAQYDGEVAYMDAAIANIFAALETQGVMDETLVVITSDHGETLNDHDCYFDHHGLYDVTLHVPMIIRYPGKVPANHRVSGYSWHPDIVPTVLELAGIPSEIKFDGASLMPMAHGAVPSHRGEFYLTECTWMRKHGWRTPQWKLIEALEPDFHYKPPLELYNLIEDPHENHNLVEQEPATAAYLKERMYAYVARREEETGLPNPIFNQHQWRSFKTSDEAYNTLHIGDPKEAARLQAGGKKK